MEILWLADFQLQVRGYCRSWIPSVSKFWKKSRWRFHARYLKRTGTRLWAKSNFQWEGPFRIWSPRIESRFYDEWSASIRWSTGQSKELDRRRSLLSLRSHLLLRFGSPCPFWWSWGWRLERCWSGWICRLWALGSTKANLSNLSRIFPL